MDIENTVNRLVPQLKKLKPQTPLEVVPGVTIRRTRGGILVARVHYSANPLRDPELHPEWKRQERATYSSQAAWDREQEIVDEAGGGELVFADTLVTYWHKIVISDPGWRPEHIGRKWRLEAGFDYGRTSPTCLLRCYIDDQGVMYFAGEYYQPQLEIFEHVQRLRMMHQITRIEACYADPSIFPETMEQGSVPGRPQERAKSINEIYVENGIELFSPFRGDRMDPSFAARLMMHWRDLGRREPTVKIVCDNYAERPDYGLHNWSCPNLLWELMRTRREKLTAQQQMNRNPSEAIVQKDNHARDAMKYVVMSHPEPTLRTIEERVAEHVRPLAEAHDLTSAYIRGLQKRAQLEEEEDDWNDPSKWDQPFPGLYIPPAFRRRRR